MTAIAASQSAWHPPAPSLRLRLAWLGAWGPIRRALRRVPPSARREFEQHVRQLAARLVALGISPRPWLVRGLPTAANADGPEVLAGALALSDRLIARGIDPAPALAHGLLPILQADPDQLDIQERLGVLERLGIGLANDERVHWERLGDELAPLAEAAFRLHRQGIDWTVEIVPEQGQTIVVEDVPLLATGPPALGTLYLVDAPRRIELVAANGLEATGRGANDGPGRGPA